MKIFETRILIGLNIMEIQKVNLKKLCHLNTIFSCTVHLKSEIISQSDAILFLLFMFEAAGERIANLIKLAIADC